MTTGMIEMADVFMPTFSVDSRTIATVTLLSATATLTVAD
jgi:hypothetical protein